MVLMMVFLPFTNRVFIRVYRALWDMGVIISVPRSSSIIRSQSCMRRTRTAAASPSWVSRENLAVS